ncbi:unnamed protein product [Closterium sp. NIES-54]
MAVAGLNPLDFSVEFGAVPVLLTKVRTRLSSGGRPFVKVQSYLYAIVGHSLRGPTDSFARSCPKRPCAVRPCSHSVALPCSYSHCLPPRTSRPAAARASRFAAPRLTPCCSLHVAPCCPARTAGAAGAGAGGTRGTGGAGAAGSGGARTRGVGAARAGGAAGAGGAGGLLELLALEVLEPHSSLPPPDSVLRQVLSLPSSTGLPLPLLCPPTDQSQPQLLPDSSLPAPAPPTERVVLPEPPASSLPHVPNPESGLARAGNPIVTRLLATVVIDPDLESTTVFALVIELVGFVSTTSQVLSLSLSLSVLRPSGVSLPLAAIAGESSSQRQTAMNAEMASWKSTGTYVDEVPPHGVNIVDGMWIFIVKRPPCSPPAFKARYVARGFSQGQGVDFFHTFSPTPKMTTLRVLLHVAAQRDFELHSLDFSTGFLQGSLHEEIWLRRPPGFTGSFLVGTQWSLRRPVYGLRQVPREWHDTLRTTLAALGFAPSSADPSLFLRTDTILPPFYVLVYVDDLFFATAGTEALALPSPLSTGHSLSALPLDESVEPSGPYPELVGCLITLGMGLVFGGQGSVVLTGHSDASWADDQATQRSSQGYTFSLGSGYVSWRSTRTSSVLSSSCEAEIYAGAMTAQELRWLTYLLTDLWERPRSPPVLYVVNKAMLALCQEQRLEHRMKHIALHFFLARELQQRRQTRLSYMAS